MKTRHKSRPFSNTVYQPGPARQDGVRLFAVDLLAGLLWMLTIGLIVALLAFLVLS